MLKRTLRIQAIAKDIIQSPTYTIRSLAQKYQVSEMTVRRDIQYIEENNLTVPQPNTEAFTVSENAAAGGALP